MMTKGRLHVVGFGPGGKDDMTFRAARVIENADIVTGYTAYVNLMKKVFTATGSAWTWLPLAQLSTSCWQPA